MAAAVRENNWLGTFPPPPSPPSLAPWTGIHALVDLQPRPRPARLPADVSGQSNDYISDALVAKNNNSVVVVTINYRLYVQNPAPLVPHCPALAPLLSASPSCKPAVSLASSAKRTDVVCLVDGDVLMYCPHRPTHPTHPPSPVHKRSIFGFLGGAAIAKRTANGTQGNFGIDDQRLAITWVREHIAAFGGDGHNIMIVGESVRQASAMFSLFRLHRTGCAWTYVGAGCCLVLSALKVGRYRADLTFLRPFPPFSRPVGTRC